MKQGWEIKKILDVVVFQRGLTYSKKDEVDFSSNIVLRSNNVDLKTNKLDFKDLKYINPEIIITENKKVTKGSLIICTANGSKSHLGKVALIDEDYDYAFGGFMGLIKPKDILNSDFLFHFMTSDTYKKFISALSDGANINNLKFSDLGELEIPLPPLPEQQSIVAILDEAFAAIAKAKANAEQNLKNAKELFESYLHGVFENKGEEWEEKTLGDVCSLYQGIAINAKTRHALVEKSDLPLLRIKDLKNNTVEQYIDPNNFPINALVNEEDIIYTRTGSLGLVFRGKRGVLHNNSFKVVPNSELTKDYLFIWLQNPIFKAKIMGLAMKAAQPDITHAIFKIQEIAIPPIKEQNKIVQKLDALSVETKKLEAIYQQKINDLEELKKSVLQKAFSGELGKSNLEKI